MTGKFKPVQNIPKTYEQFVLEEQQFSELMATSYQAEYEAEAIQGSQYGPGRKNFKDFCKKIGDSLRESLGVNTVTGRISCSSDDYIPGKNYAGAIIYAIDGEFSWKSTGGDTAGRRGRSFYVIIKCTDADRGWPPNASSYGGMVHGYLIYKALGINVTVGNNSRKVCAGGFAWEPNRTPQLRSNSGTLNTINHDVCQSDGYGALNPDEKEVVRYCWDQYTSQGTGRTFEIPLIQEWTIGGGN